MSKERDLSIDITRGIGIILMVLGHVKFPFTNFIYLFHMSLFFIASGYCNKETNFESFSSLCKFVVKKLKSLWLPFFAFQAIYTLLNNIFLDLNIYSNNPQFLMMDRGIDQMLHQRLGIVETMKELIRDFLFIGRTEMGGAFWFFRTLFAGVILYNLASWLLKQLKIKKILILQAILSALALAVSYLGQKFEVTNYASIFSVCIAYAMIYLGVLIRTYISQYDLKWKYLLFSGISLILLILCSFTGNISVGDNRYPNTLVLLVASVSGWFFVWGIAKYLCKLCVVNTVFSYIGKNATAIIALHFLAFKAVSYIYIMIHDLPAYMLASFPIIGDTGWWWVLYTIVGLIIPLGLNQLYQRCKTKVTTRL